MPREGAYFCYCAYALRIWRYRKLPFISPGFIQVRKGFWVGLSTGGGGGGGLISRWVYKRTKKNVSK